MEIVVAVLGSAFAAFYIWWGVRTLNRRQWWTKRTAVTLLIGLVVGYPLSFLTFCLLVISIEGQLPAMVKDLALVVYRPLIWLCEL